MFATWLLTAAVAAAATPSSLQRPKSIYELHLAVDVPVIAVSVATVAFAYADASHLITPSCPCDPSRVNGFDRWAIGNDSQVADVTSDVTAGLALATPLVLSLAEDGLSRELVEDLTVDGEALAVSGALVTIAKYSVQRPLPRVYAGQAPELLHSPGGYRSFYSGHTTLTATAMVSSAMQWQLRHGPSPWPWVIAGVVIASVGAERVAAGRHFPSDVLVGAAMGTAVGLVVPLLHRRKLDAGFALSLVPGGAVASFTRAL